MKKIKETYLKFFKKNPFWLILWFFLFLNLFIVGIFLGFFAAKKVAYKVGFQENLSSNSSSSSSSSSQSSADVLNPELISAEEAFEKYQKGEKIIFIDARSFEEYKKEHIKGAVWTGSENIEDKVKNLSKEDFLVTYCYGSFCGASKIVARDLLSLGFKKVFASDLSVEKWKKLGGPTEGEK